MFCSIVGDIYRNLYHYSPDYFYVFKIVLCQLRPEIQVIIGQTPVGWLRFSMQQEHFHAQNVKIKEITFRQLSRRSVRSKTFIPNIFLNPWTFKTVYTGWPVSLSPILCWHQNKSSVTVKTPYTKMQISIWCKQNIGHKLTGHPVCVFVHPWYPGASLYKLQLLSGWR